MKNRCLLLGFVFYLFKYSIEPVTNSRPFFNYEPPFISNNVTGTGNLLRDIVYRSQCKLLSCDSCCTGALSTNISCSTSSVCQEFFGFLTFKNAILPSIIVISIALVAYLFFLFFYCMRIKSKKEAVIQATLTFLFLVLFPIVVINELLICCGVMDFRIFERKIKDNSAAPNTVVPENPNINDVAPCNPTNAISNNIPSCSKLTQDLGKISLDAPNDYNNPNSAIPTLTQGYINRDKILENANLGEQGLMNIKRSCTNLSQPEEKVTKSPSSNKKEAPVDSDAPLPAMSNNL